MCCPDVSTSHPECCPSTLWWATNGSLARPRPPGDALSVDATQRSSHSFDFAIAPIGDNENSGCDAGSPHSYRHFDSQEYTESLQEGVDPYPNHHLALKVSPVTQGCIRYFTIHPILGMTFADHRDDGTVERIYEPPLESNDPWFSPFPEITRVMVRQPQYTCGTNQKGWERRQPVLFFTCESLGARLSDVLEGKVEGMDHKGRFPLENCNVISIRIHFPGYCSSTEVEKRLKQQCESNGRDKARSMRVSTKINGTPVTHSKLAKEASKRIQWHIWDLEDNKDLFPFDPRVGEKWRLGQGRMKFEHMAITGLDNVSSNSWSPAIYIELDIGMPTLSQL